MKQDDDDDGDRWPPSSRLDRKRKGAVVAVAKQQEFYGERFCVNERVSVNLERKNVFILCVCVKKSWTVFYAVIFIAEWRLYSAHSLCSRVHSTSSDDTLTTHFQCSTTASIPWKWTTCDKWARPGEQRRGEARRGENNHNNNNKSKNKIVYIF